MTTTASDTELSAVNSILGSIGQSPITTLTNPNPEIQLIQNILNESNKDIQSEGWHFNNEEGKDVQPTALGTTPETYAFNVPTDALRYDLHMGQVDRSMDLVVRDGKLYDTVTHTSSFDSNAHLLLDITTFIEFAKVPPPIQRYIVASAAVRAAAQLVSNTELVKLLNINKEKTKATALEFDCQTGDHSFFGLGHNQSYRAYQPYNALAR
jgi:hypothetical protein